MKRSTVCILFSVLVTGLLAARYVFCAERQEPERSGQREITSTSKPAENDSLKKKLSRRLSVDTEGETLANFVEKLSDEADINIVIDYSVIDSRREIRLAKIRLKSIPLGIALRAILRTVGLDYRAYEHFIFISTPTRLRQYSLEKLETRFYELKPGAADTLPKVVLVNPGGMRQGSFGSMPQLMIPVNQGLVGEPPPSGQPLKSAR